MVDTPYAIELTDMVKRFPTSDGGVYTAVSGIDLAVPAGRFVSVVGPTGCGKSTLLNAAAGLAPPTASQPEIAQAEVDVTQTYTNEFVEP